MGTFIGHAVPGTFLLIYGTCMYLHALLTSHLLSHPQLHRLVLPSEVTRAIALRQYQPDRLTRLLLDRRLQTLGYACAIIMSVTAAGVELIQWDGEWAHMTSLQHASMYGLVMMGAIVGLAVNQSLLTESSRWQTSLSFVLTGFMFYSHSQHGLYNAQVHQMVAMLLWLITSTYLLYSALNSAVYTAVYQSILAQSKANDRIIGPVLASCLSTVSKINALSLMVCGTWLYHIAFAVYSPFAAEEIMHHDHDAHLLYMQLSWHFLTLTGVTMVMEIAFRYVHWDWPIQGDVYDRLPTSLLIEQLPPSQSSDVAITINSTHRDKLVEMAKYAIEDNDYDTTASVDSDDSSTAFPLNEDAIELDSGSRHPVAKSGKTSKKSKSRTSGSKATAARFV